MRPPSNSTLFPYTTLFRSGPTARLIAGEHAIRELQVGASRGAEHALVIGKDGAAVVGGRGTLTRTTVDRKSTRLNSSHPSISYAVFCLKKKNVQQFPTCKH